MTNYIDKTRDIVDFLMHVFSGNIGMLATVQVAQAERNNERLIELLGLVKGSCEDWIEDLKAMEE